MLKRLLIVCAFTMLAVCTSANAEKLPDVERQYQELENSQVQIAWLSDTDEYYVVDYDDNIIGGPFGFASDFDSYILVENADGSNTMYDHDGSVLVSVPDGSSILPPSNGIYATYDSEDTTLLTEFKLYDYETRELLCTLDGYVYIYHEPCTDRMFVEKDGKYAVVDKDGKYYSDYVYDNVTQRFNPDYEPYPKSYAVVEQNGEKKYLDWDLNEINLDNYNGAPFITNYHPARCDTSEKSDQYYVAESGDKFGLIDTETNEYVIPLQAEYEPYCVTSDNLIIACTDDFSGIVDFNGNVIFPFEYTSFYSMNPDGNGEFLVFNKQNGDDLEYGLIRNGKIVHSGDYTKEYSPVGNGIFMNTYPATEEGYHNYATEIVNIAGHNLTGEVYTFANFSDGVFYTSKEYPHYNPDITDVPRDFAVVNLNGEYLDFDGVIRDDRTLVPMREIVEGLGGTVEWNGDDRTVHAVIDGKTINLAIGSDTMYVDGNAVTIDVPAQIINDKTMLPVRAVAENVGCDIDWDGAIRCVYITK